MAQTHDFSPFSPRKQTIPGTIWKVLPSYHSSQLVVEARNPDLRTVRGFVLDLEDGSLSSLDASLHWTDRLVAVHEGMAVWQGLADEGMPDPLGLKGLDLQTHGEAWSHDHLSYMRPGPEIIIARNPMLPDQVYFLDARQGEIRAEIPSDQLPLDDLIRFDQNQHSVLAFPSHVIPDSGEYEQTRSACQKIFPRELLGPISHLTIRQTDIFHVYHSGEELESVLIVCPLGHDPLIIPSGSYPSGFTIDPFFLIRSQLVWIEHPSTIGYLNLEP